MILRDHVLFWERLGQATGSVKSECGCPLYLLVSSQNVGVLYTCFIPCPLYLVSFIPFVPRRVVDGVEDGDVAFDAEIVIRLATASVPPNPAPVFLAAVAPHHELFARPKYAFVQDPLRWLFLVIHPIQRIVPPQLSNRGE